MPSIKVPTTFNIELEFEVPEFYRRLLALLIDGILIRIYLEIAEYLIRSVRPEDYYGWNEQYDMVALVLILQVPWLIYFPVMELLMNGQSVGKRIMGLRVVHENGGKISPGQIAIRWLVRDIWFVLVFMQFEGKQDSLSNIVQMAAIGFIVMDIVLVVSSKKGQRIGDMLAHTILIRTNTQSDINQTVFQEVADSYVPMFPQIMHLSDRDINAIKSILEIARRKDDWSMADHAADKVKKHLHIQSNLSPFDFLEVLLKDYNYLSTK